MKINQVAELAGITSKNIRFYEDQGLISPDRDPQNGYREYTLEDAEQLGRIRLLRQLGIPCDTIRRLQSGELDFDACMSEHMEKLDRKGRDLEHMKAICRLKSFRSKRLLCRSSCRSSIRLCPTTLGSLKLFIKRRTTTICVVLR